MTFLQIYLYANASILFFWLFYKVFLRNVNSFQANRFYLVSAFLISGLLPFLQNELSAFLNNQESFVESGLYNFIYLNTSSIKAGEPVQSGLSSVSLLSFVKVLLLLGALVCALRIIFMHLRISRLIKKSSLFMSDKANVYISQEHFIPFVYHNTILIPDSVPPSEYNMIIRHESYHHKLGHHYDNLISQLFEIVFWANPFMYLLKRELFQLHEYQVDQLVVASGVDPVEYNLILIRSSAGKNKFTVANGFKDSSIKKRIIMINTRISQRGTWKYFLLLPALGLLLMIMSFSSIQSHFEQEPIEIAPKVETVQQVDSIKMELVKLDEKLMLDDNQTVVVAINKVSDVMIEGLYAPKGKRVSMITEAYTKHRKDRFFKNQSSDIMIITYKDMKTNNEDYKALLNEIGTAVKSLQESISRSTFSKSVSELNKDEQKKILELVPPKIYYASPSHMKPPPPRKK